MLRIAIIGTGIAGMGCGHFLHSHHDLTFFEQNDYIGGHTNTVTIDESGTPIPVDTGFMVFNYQTYPNLCRLFTAINAPVKKTDMSFSVQHLPSGLEYSGSSLNHLFAQRRNLFRPSFLRMLRQISRFNSQSIHILDDPRYEQISLGDYIKMGGFGDDMLWKYLIPMSSAVWSTPMDKMLEFPAATLIRFFYNHGFLGLHTQHQWYTLENGSQSYRELLIQPFRRNIHPNNKVVRVIRNSPHAFAGVDNPNGPGAVTLLTADGNLHSFDRVILACHGDQALALLDEPTPDERHILGAFRYQPNLAILHTDASIMPRTRLAWSSWNYRIREHQGRLVPSTIYWMNRLQHPGHPTNYFVSINDRESLDERSILKEIAYEHPLFDNAAIRAQQQLPRINTHGPVYFCGSYFKYGFHEDAFTSALQLCSHLLSFKDPEKIWPNS